MKADSAFTALHNAKMRYRMESGGWGFLFAHAVQRADDEALQNDAAKLGQSLQTLRAVFIPPQIWGNRLFSLPL